ncbi:hypothetical protein CVT30_00845 [Streptomyces sp. AMCC400023]|nr:hypothetical protein CVT30_00845 [Streptomyces sp. AMCC400023]
MITRPTTTSKRSRRSSSFSADPHRNATPERDSSTRASTRSRTITHPYRSSQPSGTGYGGSLTISPLTRSIQRLKPSSSASSAT